MSEVSVAVGDLWWVRVKNQIMKREITDLSPKRSVIRLGHRVSNPMELDTRYINENYDVREVEFLECLEINELPTNHGMVEKFPSNIVVSRKVTR